MYFDWSKISSSDLLPVAILENANDVEYPILKNRFKKKILMQDFEVQNAIILYFAPQYPTYGRFYNFKVQSII